jgi:hypothetical protein
MDVNAIVDGSGDGRIGAELQAGSAVNVKRYIRRDVANYFRARCGKSILDSRYCRNEDGLAPDWAVKRRNAGVMRRGRIIHTH